jgi:hypothetical protein
VPHDTRCLPVVLASRGSITFKGGDSWGLAQGEPRDYCLTNEGNPSTDVPAPIP